MEQWSKWAKDNSQSNIVKYISNVEKMIQKCRNYGVKKIFISGLVSSAKVSLPMLERFTKIGRIVWFFRFGIYR